MSRLWIQLINKKCVKVLRNSVEVYEQRDARGNITAGEGGVRFAGVLDLDDKAPTSDNSRGSGRLQMV